MTLMLQLVFLLLVCQHATAQAPNKKPVKPPPPVATIKNPGKPPTISSTSVNLQKAMDALVAKNNPDGEYDLYTFKTGFKARAIITQGSIDSVLVRTQKGAPIDTQTRNDGKTGTTGTCMITKCFTNDKRQTECFTYACPTTTE